MIKIVLDDFGPIISDRDTGEEIYNLIKKGLEKDDVSVDLSNIKSMATFCAKQIFGKLYVENGAATFFDKLEIKNASDDLKTIIKIGIKSAIDEVG
jgi:hypothetical protein